MANNIDWFLVKVRVLEKKKEMNSCHQGTRGGGERAPLPFLLFGDV